MIYCPVWDKMCYKCKFFYPYIFPPGNLNSLLMTIGKFPDSHLNETNDVLI